MSATEVRGPSIPHVAALDGVRGAAIAGVLLFHGGRLRGGYLGVDLFFTLSGFLITTLLLAEATRTGGVGLGGFWARRARRLLPALVVMLLGVAGYCLVFAASDQLNQIRGDALATVAYVANWRAVGVHRDYWGIFNAPSPLNHTWSLAIEEQFYVIWPLVFAGLLTWWKGVTAKIVLAVSLGLATVSSVLMIVLYDPGNSARAYFGTDTRAAAILFGAALAAWLALKGPTKRRVALEVVGLVGAAVLAVSWLRLDGQSNTLYRGGFLVCGLCATAVVAAVMHPRPGVLSRVFSFRPLCLLGLVSYGVYLYHWPIDVFLDSKRAGGLEGWSLFALRTAVTLVVAIVSYRVVEQPIRRGAIESRQWRSLTPAIAVGTVAILVFATWGGHPRAQRPVAGAALNRLMWLGASRAAIDAPPNATRVLVVGNSVGYFLGQSMQHVARRAPIATFDAAYPSCTFPPEITDLRMVTPEGTTVVSKTIPCDSGWEARVVKIFRPDIVFWIVSDPVPDGLRYRGQWLEPCTEPYESLYQRSLTREVGVLGARGAKVVLATAAYPGLLPKKLRPPTDCDNRLRRTVAAATGAQLVDLSRYVCPGGTCRVRQNGVILRPDTVHFEGPGGLIIADWLLDQVKSAPKRA